MKSKIYPVFPIKCYAYSFIAAVFMALAMLSAVKVTGLPGKLISSFVLGTFSGIFIGYIVLLVSTRKQVLREFIKELDATSFGVNRKFIFLIANNARTQEEDVLKEVNNLCILLKFGAARILFDLEVSLKTFADLHSINFDAYDPYIFIRINSKGSLLNRHKEQVAGYQDGNWLEVTYNPAAPSLMPIVLHELSHLILSRSGFTGNQHAVILKTLEKVCPETVKKD